jgi:CBS domain containing-hemolysin-like protein
MAISNNLNGFQSSDRQDGGPSWLDRLAAKVGLSSQVDARAVIQEALRNDNGAAFTPGERAMLQKTLRFKDLRVEDVMVPRSEIIAVDEDATLGNLLAVFAEAGHSRAPVYRDTLDEPLGMVHVKDLMGWVMSEGRAGADGGGFNLGAADLSKTIAEVDIMRELIFAPPSMSALDLLVRMQSRHVHLALIIDEHGGTDGLVSIEDLLEEVVGNIEDEHDADDEPMMQDDADGLVADARAEIEDVESRTGIALSSADDEDVETIGGLIFTMLGRVPVRGEVIHHPAGIEFEVLDADRRRVKKLKLRLPKKTVGGSGVHIHAP